MCFEEQVQKICQAALAIFKEPDLKFKPMRRKRPIDTKRSFVIGRTNLKTKLITIDIFTPKQRQPKKISAILRTLCHEVAHHQKPPYRQFYRFKWINRQHYPEFYQQVQKNLEKLKKHPELANFF